MELVQFYLHLPSKSSLDKFPNNTLTEYRVGLPQTVSLAGDWEVGLTEIRYRHTCNNVQGNFQDLFYIRNQELSGVWEVLIIQLGHYASIGAILSKMKELVDNEKCFNDDVRFSYDTLSRKVTVHLPNNAELFFGEVGYLLGFSPKEVISQTSTAEREADITAFSIFTFIVILFNHNVSGTHLFPCFESSQLKERMDNRSNKSFLHRNMYLSAESSSKRTKSI